MNILGIESSCDETAAAVYGDDGLKSNIIASQTIHERFGGVVPELASRAHQETIWLTVQQALNEANMDMDDIDVIAVTHGPGLMGALLVGLSFAKGLSISYNKPLIGVNHIDAHVYANFIDETPEFPFLGLIVSGGHTQIIYAEKPFKHKILGQTRDDAAGEAFDKIGKILQLPYPAGPHIDKLSQTGDIHFHKFPQALLEDGFEFSFSGLKTSALYYINDIPEEEQESFLKEHLNDISASVSHAITEVLIKKLGKAIKKTHARTVILAGGVSANSMLRQKAQKMAKKHNVNLYYPKLVYCTDNAAMIAVTGYLKAQRQLFDDIRIKPFASLSDVVKTR
ncbi:MAG TPA: tRNA (adenosine(37)-N6)-threonylcarbamoyltransferase complex transferase subunit TsaD [Balneolales bacterium]|nr:tRNA (adenosine(37)-N6)-threonylcarbamoyltransferase complex transferase subunit TsaD [Balneolales bacterium]